MAIVAFSPLGSGMLSGKFRSPADLASNDFRRMLPRFSEENFPKNLRIADEFTALARRKGCTSSQLALAWVAAQGAIPIPGTRSAERLEENWGAATVELSEKELVEIRKLVTDAKPVGERLPKMFLDAIGH